MTFPPVYGPASGCEDCTSSDLCKECSLNWETAITALDCACTVLGECLEAEDDLLKKMEIAGHLVYLADLRRDSLQQFGALVDPYHHGREWRQLLPNELEDAEDRPA